MKRILVMLWLSTAAGVQAVTFQITNANVNPGAEIVVPVKVSGFSGVTTVQFSLQWNPSVLQFLGTGDFGLPQLGPGNFGTATGKLGVSWDDPDTIGKSLADGATMFSVRFSAIGANGSNSSVSFGDSPTSREVTIDLNPAAFTGQPGTIQVGDPSACTPPSITTGPASQTQVVGSSASFSVVASGTAPLTYQWKKNAADISGATGSSLTLAGLQESDAGNYTVVVSNGCGSVASSAATLSVTAAPPPAAQAPAITFHPSSQTALAGGNITFNVGATGTEPLAFQWRKNGANLAGATSSSLVLSNVSTNDAGAYSVVISNAVGSVTSAAATLAVNPPPVPDRPPVITAQPAGQSRLRGTQAVFSVDASSATPLSYQWRKNGTDLAGAASAVLLLNNVQPSDAGSYTVVVGNSAGSVESAAAVLTVGVPPSITAQPVSRVAPVATNVTFAVQTAGSAPLTYLWRKDGNAIAGATNQLLTLSNLRTSDTGEYTVAVSNDFGSVTSAIASLTVQAPPPPPEPDRPPSILAQPANLTREAGAEALFSVQAAGTAPLLYQWRKEGVDIPGANDSSLVLHKVGSSDAATYSVVVRNAFGSVTSALVRLTVTTPPPPAEAPPRITAQPLSQVKFPGESVHLTVEFAASPPVSFFWLKDGAQIPGATNATLTVRNLRQSDSGRYTVIVATPHGLAIGQPATLTVQGDPNAPQIAPVILGHPQNQAATAGADVRISADITGTPPLDYRWFKDGQLIPGATDPVLLLRNVQASDEGNYRLNVSNLAGSASTVSARLTVHLPPVVIQSPASLTKRAGENAEFTVQTSGSAPLTYQWRKDGSDIAGATDRVFMLSQVQPHDAGQYSVTVRNPYGMAVSSNATLLVTVLQLPRVRGDFNSDGEPDLVFQDDNARLRSWIMKGPALDFEGFFLPDRLGDPGLEIAASGDFNRDAQPDLILQHSDGSLAAWLLNGTIRSSSVSLAPNHPGDARWRVVASGDFNRDGADDLLFQHADGSLGIWFMDGLRLVSSAMPQPSHPGESWRAAGAADFNGDGKLDILFQHEIGFLALWQMDGLTLVNSIFLQPEHPGDANWRVAGTHDRNGDSKPDLLFQHAADRTVAVWYLDGTKLIGAQTLAPASPGGTWRVVAP